MNFRLITVGIADLKVVSSPDILRTILGSCVGICLYDPEKKIAGMSHIMLPSRNESSSSELKYADSAIPLLIKEVKRAGARADRLVSKIVGGASMFKLKHNKLMSEIGRNNIKKVLELLADLNISVVAKDIGGDYGRTIDFYAKNGILRIKTIGRVEKEI